ncbi:MAG: DUF4115 domain-containing protein [Anaerolineae bacterium]|nr:DUF4115 domain-containing protein [Anaerolineae bacterium]
MNDAVALGQRLREAREARELTLDGAERVTRIRAKFLEALERGDYSSMTPVQAQGFLRNYARFLGIDLDLLLADLDAEHGRRRKRRRGKHAADSDTQVNGVTIPEPAQPSYGPSMGSGYPSYTPSPVARPIPRPDTAPSPPRQSARSRPQRGLWGNLAIVLIAGAIVAGLVLGLTAVIDRLVATPASSDQSSSGVGETVVPEVSPEAAGGEQPAEAVEGEFQAPVAAFTPPVLTGASVTVTIQVVQRTWLRVTVDGQVAREGTARTGEVWQFEGSQSVAVRTSNAAGLELTVNNQPQGVLGERGELFDYTFSLSGTPVPTLPPTQAEDGAALAPTETSVSEVVENDEPSLLTASPDQATLLFTPTGGVVSPTGGVVSPTGGVVSPTATLVLAPGSGAEVQSATPTEDTGAAAVDADAPPTLRFTLTPSITPTPLPTATATDTSTATPTVTHTPIASASASSTPSATVTRTPTATLSPTATATPSATPFLPPRQTRTPSPVPK